MRGHSTGSVNERTVPGRSGQGDRDSRRGWRGSLARFLLRDSAPSRAAARRADAPHPPQHAHRRNAPWVTRSASWLGRSSRARYADRRMKDDSHRAGTPRIIRAGPSSVKGTRRSFLKPLRRNDLRDPPLSAGDLCQPSGPDGGGQARGQARWARGGPLRVAQ